MSKKETHREKDDRLLYEKGYAKGIVDGISIEQNGKLRAIQFAEWIRSNQMKHPRYLETNAYTTEELYEIFVEIEEDKRESNFDFGFDDSWNGRCVCGHLHSEHHPIQSHNYSAGHCTVGECRCKYFTSGNIKGYGKRNID